MGEYHPAKPMQTEGLDSFSYDLKKNAFIKFDFDLAHKMEMIMEWAYKNGQQVWENVSVPKNRDINNLRSI